MPEVPTDTLLTFSDKDKISYGTFAEKIVDPNPHVRAVMLDACHSFCSRLKDSATKGEGKLVIAASDYSKVGTGPGIYLLSNAMAKIISSTEPVRLGYEYEKQLKQLRGDSKKGLEI